MSELWVFLCSDTEDNYPTYVPKWSKTGSNYDRNPAVIRWDWTKYWDDLSEYFKRLKIPITWLIRVDDGPIYDTMLKNFLPKILELKSQGDEIGIHIHTFVWDSYRMKWKQERDPILEAKIVHRSLKYFRDVLGFSPISARMGWNAMSNEIMQILDQNDVIVDASAIPGDYCKGKFGGRDNFYDWLRSPCTPYHPSRSDYQSEGKKHILEMPISSLPIRLRSRVNEVSSIINLLLRFRFNFVPSEILPMIRRLRIAPYSFFYISPFWSTSVINKIIDLQASRARKEGIAFLVGFFHSSDIYDPHLGNKNYHFIQNLNSVINRILESKKISVRFLTLSQGALKYKDTIECCVTESK